MNTPNKRLLHVEDDPDFSSYVQLILGEIVDIDLAATMKQAQDMATQNEYDVILLDLTLPDGSGMTILNEFKTSHPDIPIVIFSSHSVTDTMINVASSFQKDHFSEENLVEVIKQLTG